MPQRPYRERGIKELDGYGAELVTLEFAYAVSVDPSDRTYLAAPGTASRARFGIAVADADADADLAGRFPTFPHGKGRFLREKPFLTRTSG